MQQDFHYYVIAFLANQAGFTKSQSKTIAYASQYVDDSTESRPLRIGDIRFDPVRTAHMGIHSFGWTVHKQVFIPFHFLPPKPIRSNKESLVTEPGGKLAREILKDAFQETNADLRLCRIGVALHTFADTWAHQSFSGRTGNENDVDRLRVFKDGKWRRNIFHDAKDTLTDFVGAKVGHLQAVHTPDIPYLTWKSIRPGLTSISKSVRDNRKKPVLEITRDNQKEFLRAAKAIYNELRKFVSSRKDIWPSIKPTIASMFALEKKAEERCAEWLKVLSWLTPYKSLDWRLEAVTPVGKSSADWDNIKPNDLERLEFKMQPGFWKSRWVFFHRASLLQRHLVLQKLQLCFH
jgi:hypothetical protein